VHHLHAVGHIFGFVVGCPNLITRFMGELLLDPIAVPPHLVHVRGEGRAEPVVGVLAENSLREQLFECPIAENLAPVAWSGKHIAMFSGQLPYALEHSDGWS
jgi:hypothetical protein